MSNDITILRDLAGRYMEIAADSIQEERRDLWTRHNSLEKTRTPIIILTGYWDMWCRDHFSDRTMKCEDPFYREYERQLRLMLFHAEWGDDYIFEPWITVPAVQGRGWNDVWGIEIKHQALRGDGTAWRFAPEMLDLADTGRLSWPVHRIDEEATTANFERLGSAIGEILPVNCDRGPLCQGFMGDISTHLAQMRGMEELMVDMCEEPEQLVTLLAWMRDGILANQQAAEDAGDISQTSQQNQTMTYGRTTLPPKPNSHGVARKNLWAYCAAQEFTGVSPEMHDEFMLRYQMPILEHWGLSAYGCCEDLTLKIDLLRQIRNLRIIAVAPLANVARCAEQIGADYVMSWRPNPANMVTCGFDADKIRRNLKENLEAARGCTIHINLKDVYTLEGDVSRLARWVKIAREVVDEVGH